MTAVRFPTKTLISLYFLCAQHLSDQLSFIYSGQAPSQGGASRPIAPTKNLDAPARNLQNVEHKHADQVAKERASRVASVEQPWLEKKNSFSKTYVHVRCFVPRYTERYVIKVLTLWSRQRHFSRWYIYYRPIYTW